MVNVSVVLILKDKVEVSREFQDTLLLRLDAFIHVTHFYLYPLPLR
jgi:hypothetical protein